MANGGGGCATPARAALELGPIVTDLYGDPRLAPLLRRLLVHSGRLLDVGAGSISLIDAQRGRYVKMAERGAFCRLGQTFSLDEGITGQVVAQRAPVVLARYSTVSGGHLPAAHQANRGAVAAVPIWWRGDVIGAHVAFAGRSRRFTTAEVDELETLTQVAAAGIVSAGASDPSLVHLVRDHLPDGPRVTAVTEPTVVVRKRTPGPAVPRQPAPTHRPSPLTAREGQTLVLLARGLTDRQVAATLVISPRTVEKHVGAVLRKTGATSRTGAVVCAIDRGWLPKAGADGGFPPCPRPGHGFD